MTTTKDDGRSRTDGGQRADAPQRTDAPRMRDVQHTHPITGESFQNAYWRGPVVADGGGDERAPDEVSHPSPRSEESATPASDDEASQATGTEVDQTADVEADQTADVEADQTASEMRDVDHTPPSEEASANRVWERGNDVEGAEDSEDGDNETAGR